MTIYAWTPCSDGTIKKVDATSIVMSVDTGCTETWIAVANTLALVPGRRGEVVSMNGLGTIKDRRTLQHRIAIAVGVVNDVYCFDGRGKGTIVTLDNNGLITVGEKFICSGVVDPMNAILDGTTIYIACRNEDVYSFETTTQITTRISSNHDDVLTSVVDNNTITKLHNNTIYARLFGGAVIGGTDYFVGNGAIHTTASRVIDSRIRADGICAQVGSDGTQFIKSCPSRKSIQWITGSNIATEIILDVKCGAFVFSPSNGTSNETPVTDFGGGVYAVYSPIFSLPEPVYSSVTITITNAPNIPGGSGSGMDGHGSELNGTYTIPLFSDDGETQQYRYSVGTGLAGDPQTTLIFEHRSTTPRNLSVEVGRGDICSTNPPYLVYMYIYCGLAVYSSGGRGWAVYSYTSNPRHPVGAITPLATGGNALGWLPVGCPSPHGDIAIVSWNR